MKRFANILFLLILTGALAAVPLATLLSDRPDYSYWENRSLEPFPEITAEGILDGSLFQSVERYFSDHMAGRDRILTLNTRAELELLQKPVVNDQVVTRDVLLNYHGFGSWDVSWMEAKAQEIAEELEVLDRQVTDYGGYFLYVGVPQKYCYFSDRYPDYLDDRRWTMGPARESFAAALAQRDIPILEMMEVYDGLGRPPELYSAVDHHYTYAGALVAYEALTERLARDTGWELPFCTEGDGLTVRELDNHYIGSQSRKLYDLWPSRERAGIGELTEPIPFTREDNGVAVEASLYALPATAEEDVLYTVYMGGDVAETAIRTDRPELPNALIVGESFTNAVETVLWTGFNETRSLDLRYYTGGTLAEYIEAWEPDVVICLRDDGSYLTPLA